MRVVARALFTMVIIRLCSWKCLVVGVMVMNTENEYYCPLLLAMDVIMVM